MFQVIYYSENEHYPVIEFIQSLPTKDVAIILLEIDLLEEYGYSLGMPHIKKMTGSKELWELRIKHSSNNYRVFYFHYTNNKYVLLHAIHKKTSKTPKSDIKTAENRITKFLKKGGQ